MSRGLAFPDVPLAAFAVPQAAGKESKVFRPGQSDPSSSPSISEYEDRRRGVTRNAHRPRAPVVPEMGGNYWFLAWLLAIAPWPLIERIPHCKVRVFIQATRDPEARRNLCERRRE